MSTMLTSSISWKKWLPQYASIFDVRFFPQNQFSKQTFDTTRQQLGIFLIGFFRTKNPKWFDSPQPDAFTEIFRWHRDPGSSWRFHPWQVPTHHHDVVEAPGGEWEMLMIECLYGWVVGQISHCFAVLMAYGLIIYLYIFICIFIYRYYCWE